MKKILLSVAFIVATLTGANAQTSLIDVDFSDLDALEGWYIINADGDSFNWGVQVTAIDASTNQGFSGGFAFSASYDNTLGPLTPDNGLITQAFTIPEDLGAVLTYKVGGLDPDFYAEHYAVYVIEDSPIFEDEEATIADIFALYSSAVPVFEETVGSVTATEKTVNLDAYSGQTVRLVFRHYNSTDVFYLILDDVSVITQTLSVNSVLENSFSVYPNPVKDVLNISNSAGEEINSLTIVDINGRTVKQVNSNVSQINISDLNAGVYFVNISSNEGNLTTKIVKQ